MAKSSTARTVRRARTARTAPAVVVEPIASPAALLIWDAERAMIAGERDARSAFCLLCKEAEKAFPRKGSTDEQKAYKADMALTIFAARMGLPVATADDVEHVKEVRSSIVLREKPARKAFPDDKAFAVALAIYAANNAAKTRVSEVFGAKGAKHWENPLAKDDDARETRKRGASTDKAGDTTDAADAAHVPNFKGSEDDAGAWAGEFMLHLARVAKANPKCARLAAFAKGAQAALDAAYPATV